MLNDFWTVYVIETDKYLQEKWDQISEMGFDDRFRRMWNFYLTSCASTFHYGNCDVTQITIEKPS